MEYNSFYGGRRGASFIIVKKYASIAEMTAAFSQGGDYKTVNYGEYVLINTENKNNPDNGKVYRRGYGYNEELGGAIYVGQIVGPGGPAPQVAMDTYNKVNNKSAQEGYTNRKSSGSYTVSNSSLVPGKKVNPNTGAVTYNDSIKWVAYSMRDNNGLDTTAYLGFQIPYLVVDYTVDLTDPYSLDSNNVATVSRVDDGTHPFYECWNFAIPNGIKGDSVSNIRAMIADNTIENYPTKADDIANHREVIVYDLYSYENSIQGTYKTYYLGSVNDVTGITVSNTGLITITYSHKDTETYQLKFPTSVSIDTGSTEGTGTQKVQINYTDGTSQVIGKPLNYIMQTAIDSRYHLLVYYSDPAKRSSFSPKATYNGKNDWSDLGYIGNGTGVGAVAGAESDSGVSSIASTMPTYSAWFIVEDDGA